MMQASLESFTSLLQTPSAFHVSIFLHLNFCRANLSYSLYKLIFFNFDSAEFNDPNDKQVFSSKHRAEWQKQCNIIDQTRKSIHPSVLILQKNQRSKKRQIQPPKIIRQMYSNFVYYWCYQGRHKTHC